MFYSFIKKKMDNIEKARDVYRILFASMDVTRTKYNLTYLGEVFERHEERGLSVEDVLFGVVLGGELKHSFIDDSINTNQFQLFKSRYDADMQNYKPINHLAYIVLLTLMDKQVDAEEELLKFIDNNTLNENFLLLLEGFKNNVFVLSNTVQKAIVTKLENYKFDIDFISLLDMTYEYFYFTSLYVNIRDIIKILNLKSGMFKNKEIFNILNSYKKIGSNRILKSDASTMLKCFEESEDVFWLLNFKIANETLSQDGQAIITAKSSFVSYINESLNIERDNFELFTKIRGISLKNKDFSNFDESKYPKLIKLYDNNHITATNIGRGIFASNSFINLFKELINSDDVSQYTFVEFYFDAMSTSDNMEDKEFFFNLIKEYNSSISYNQYAILVASGLMGIEEAIASSGKDLIEVLYREDGISDIELATAIINVVLNGSIKVEAVFRQSLAKSDRRHYSTSTYTCNFVYTTIKEYIETDECISDKDKIALIQKLERFLYLTSKSTTHIRDDLYIEFILYSFNNELYKTALGMSEEDVKNIARTILSFKGIKDFDIAHSLNKFAYSEREANLMALEKEYENLKIYIAKSYTSYYSRELKSFLPKVEKLGVREKYEKALADLAESLLHLNVGYFTELIVILYKANVISKEKRNELMLLKLDKECGN